MGVCPPAMDNEYLLGKLEEAFATDARVSMLDIRATIAHGRLHLTGEAPTEERRIAVEQVAREVLPELDVRNEVTVTELTRATKPEALDG